MPTYSDTILCEDVRPELNNKLMLAGVFGDEIIVPQIPAVLESLCFVQRWRVPNDEVDRGTGQFSFVIEWPNGQKQIIPPAGPAVVGKGVHTANLTFVFKFAGFPLHSKGEHKFRTSINDVEKNVFSFYVATAAELAALAQPKPKIGFRQ